MVSNEIEDLWNNIKMINSALKLFEKEDTFDREIENGDKGNGNESEDLRENTESMKSFPVAKFDNEDTIVKNEDGEVVFQCPLCDRKYPSKKKLKIPGAKTI